MAPKRVKLIYFDGRGRAEPIRILLSYAGVKFENEVMPMDDTWAQAKPSKSDFIIYG